MRKIIVGIGAVIAVGLVAQAFWHVFPFGGDGYVAPSLVPVQRDYHDPLQLSEAVKDHYRGQYAGCARLPAGTYTCMVTAGGAGADYTVTVSADGKSWSAG